MFPNLISKVMEREKEGFRWLYYYVTPEDTARAFRLALEVENVPYDVLLVGAARASAQEAARIESWLATALL